MVKSSAFAGGVAFAVFSLLAGQAASSSAADLALPTHDYQMDESPGATTMLDTGTTPVNGTIGSEVITGVVYDGAVGYRFPRLVPNQPPAHPEHLVRIPDDPSLDPGSGDFTVEVRYRTTNKFGNLIQKGQSATKGGQVKIQLPMGRPSCYYKGSAGRVGTGSPTPINDGQWHVLRCTRTSSAVELYVDGVRVGRNVGNPGVIDNTIPWTIGGKDYCDQITISCDYFGGDVDYVRLTQG